MNPVDPRRHPITFYADLLNSRTPFSLSRWGDGEWACLLGDKGENCDGHAYFPALAYDLALVLRQNRPYYKGWLAVARKAGAERIEKHLSELRQEIAWVDGDVFLDSSMRGALYPLIQALRKKRVLYVGPPALADLPRVIGWQNAGFLHVPTKNAYLQKDDLRTEIRAALRVLRVDVIGFSAGMLTNVLIDELHPAIGARVTMLDFGSLFDIYCGVQSRSHNRAGDWETLIRKNLGG